ncbi:MAG: CpaD family pilus assembly protein [Aestuariivirgaceae bacterium]
MIRPMLAPRPHRRIAMKLATLLLHVGLTGCGADLAAELDDVYTPPLHYQRHPVTVTRSTARIELVPHDGGLTAVERNEVARFAQSALANASHSIGLEHPKGARRTAEEVASILMREGVPPARIVASAYRGRGPVVLTFARTTAVTAPCGDWSRNLTLTGDNRPYPDFGCAHQRNIAAIVANPNDFVMPRAETPPDAPRRSQVFTDYRAPKDPSTPVNARQNATISEVGQ